MAETLARVFAPRASGIELNVAAPMATRLLERTEFFADERQIVVSVGIIRVQRNRLAQVVARIFEAARFVEHAAKIKLRERVSRL